ncbi:MAG: hypothetical protein H8D23_21685 [Candidatus Brocadiales bacterium]|nr:hypothetical protein [Candidatus Brocadiales bacterium]
MKRYLVVPDLHIPLHDSKYLDVVLQSIKIIKPDGYVNLGDLGEWGSVSSWQWKKKKRPPLEYQLPEIQKDIWEVNNVLDIIDESLDKVNCKEKYQIQGNHDYWVDSFAEENPFVEHIHSFDEVTRLADREYDYYPIISNPQELLKIGKLYYYHGDRFGGINHGRMHLLKMGCNVIYGHWHDVQQYTLTHVDGPKSAWSIGCGKDMSAQANPWLKGKLNNWHHAFAVVDYFGEGRFTVHTIMVIDGQCSLWGHLISGKEKKHGY